MLHIRTWNVVVVWFVELSIWVHEHSTLKDCGQARNNFMRDLSLCKLIALLLLPYSQIINWSKSFNLFHLL